MSEANTIFSNEHKMKNWKDSYLWVEALFYLLQGMFLAGISSYGAVKLAEWNIPLDQQATFTAITGIPAFLKMFMGLLSDRVVVGKWGRRKPYIVLGLLINIPAFILYLATDQFTGLFIAQLLAMLAWAIIDTTLDALAVDITPEEYDSRMQSSAMAGRFAGLAIGAFLVPTLGPIIGMTTVIVIIGLCGLLMPITALVIRETKITQVDLKGAMPLKQALKMAFSHKNIWLGLGVSIILFAGFSMTLVNNHVLTNFGWADDPVKLQGYGIASLFGMMGAMVGAVLMGQIYKRTGFNIKTVVASLVAFEVLTALWFLFDLNSDSVLIFGLCVFLRSIGDGMMGVTGSTVVMRVAQPSIEGFTFALMTSMMNIGQMLIAPMVLRSTLPAIGIMPSLLILSLAAVIGVVLIGMILKDETATESAEAEVVAA